MLGGHRDWLFLCLSCQNGDTLYYPYHILQRYLVQLEGKNDSVILGGWRVRVGSVKDEGERREIGGVDVETTAGSLLEGVLHCYHTCGTRSGVTEPGRILDPGGAQRLEIDPSFGGEICQGVVDLVVSDSDTGHQNEETGQGNWLPDSRDVVSRGGLIDVEKFGVGQSRRVIRSHGGGPDVGLVLCKTSEGNTFLFLDLVESEDRSAFGVGWRRLDGVDGGRSACNDSDEREECGERDGETKQHG